MNLSTTCDSLQREEAAFYILIAHKSQNIPLFSQNIRPDLGCDAFQNMC